MAAEKELTRLRKLPENRVCPNCGTKADCFGFQAIVVPFKIFVCSGCKSAHQAFSHRCKSASMSNWTMEEVLLLDEQNGGGNRSAAARWLANVPDNVRPQPGAPQEVLKQFIDQAYNKLAWEGKAAPPPPREAAPPVASRPAPAPVAQARRQPAETVDLLGASVETPQQSAPPAAQPAEGNLLDEDFFQPANTASGSSAFSFVTAAASPQQAASSSAFPFASSSGQPQQANVPSSSFGDLCFDPFAPSSGQAAPQPPQQSQLFQQLQQHAPQQNTQQQLQQQQQQQHLLQQNQQQQQQLPFQQQQPFHQQQQFQQQQHQQQQPQQQHQHQFQHQLQQQLPHQQHQECMQNQQPMLSFHQPQLHQSQLFMQQQSLLPQQPYQQQQIQQPFAMPAAGYPSCAQQQLPAAPLATGTGGGLFQGLTPASRPAAPDSSSPSGLTDMFDPFAPVAAPGQAPSNGIRA
eukprot:TRINITY_DN4924_c1_g1_i1.p1 TRINITY_DN4924_c1_g1~~TRINITY_DN4924_c1_g1_i1.p1  ORF type:complete len:461 (-),score=106.99 TRINITY_DN4924_c1_g1_i1:42-1424(-)